jgi:hypothetical protein
MESEFGFVLERRLYFSVQGVESQGMLRIGGLKETQGPAGSRCWICLWSLDKIHPHPGRIYGEDALDALVKCLEFLVELLKQHESLGTVIWWLERGDYGGLSISQTTRS